MFLLVVELGDTLDRHVIGLGRTRSKKYLLRVGADETRNLSVSCSSTCEASSGRTPKAVSTA